MIFADWHCLSRELRSSFARIVRTFGCGEKHLQAWKVRRAGFQLTPEQQAMFVHTAPRAFVSVPGGWGRLGATNVVLAQAEETIVESALILAWRNAAPKSLLESTDEP